ncbi:MAG: hypothetical protein U0414_31170 [Polyangiaceae bacterium]
MRLHRTSAVIACVALASAALVARDARAHDDSGGTQLPTRAAPVTKDGEAAVALLKAIEASADSLAVAKDQVDRAWKAIARAEGAKLSGDEEGARLLSGLALELARGADALARAAAAEKKADAAEKQAAALQEKLERLRTLLAETDARRVQVTAEVDKARNAEKPPPKTTPPKTTPPKTTPPKTPATPPAKPPQAPPTPAPPAKDPPKAAKP